MTRNRQVAKQYAGGLWCVSRDCSEGRLWANGGTVMVASEIGMLEVPMPAWSRRDVALYLDHQAVALVLLLEDAYPGVRTYRVF